MLLDSAFLIDLQRELAGRRVRRAVTFLNDHAEQTPWISLITWMEFAEGYSSEEEEACRRFLSRFPLVLPDPAIAWRASRISRQLRQEGLMIGDHDVWIAATALDRKYLWSRAILDTSSASRVWNCSPTESRARSGNEQARVLTS